MHPVAKKMVKFYFRGVTTEPYHIAGERTSGQKVKKNMADSDDIMILRVTNIHDTYMDVYRVFSNKNCQSPQMT